MSLAKAELIELYRRRARRYDFTANLCYLIGYREWACRRGFSYLAVGRAGGAN